MKTPSEIRNQQRARRRAASLLGNYGRVLRGEHAHMTGVQFAFVIVGAIVVFLLHLAVIALIALMFFWNITDIQNVGPNFWNIFWLVIASLWALGLLMDQGRR